MGLDWCPWSWSCYTCFLPNLSSLGSHLKLHIFQLNISMYHVNFNHTYWPTQRVCLSSWWQGNPMPCIYLHISSFFFIIICFILCLSIYLFCQVFYDALVSGNWICPLFPFIRIIIVTTELDIPDGSNHLIYLIPGSLRHLILLWGVTNCLIKRFKIPLSHLIVFYYFPLNLKTMITWWSWTTFIIIVFCVSSFNYIE